MFSLIWSAATILNTALAVWIMTARRQAILRPSVQVSLFYLVLVAWPTSLRLDEVEALLPDPSILVLLVQVLVFLPLAAAVLRDDRLTAAIWGKLALGRFNRYSHAPAELPLLLLLSALVFVWYFSVVPLSSTGLYVVFTDPAEAAVARELSFKLLESSGLRYAFSGFSSAIAPVLLIMLLAALSRSAGVAGVWRVPKLVVGLAAVLTLTLLTAVTGARSFAAALWMTAIAAFWICRSLSPGIAVRLGFAAMVVLVAPVGLTLAREGKLGELPLFFDYFWDFVAYRLFTGPSEVASWYVHYAQTEGFFGVAGVPKLAELFGYMPVDVPNLIGRAYYGGTLVSVNANTGFAFSYYSYFGLPGWLLSLAGLFLLDGVLHIYARLEGILLLGCVAATSVAALAFTYADFTTVLLTHGFLLAPCMCLALSTAVRLLRSHADSGRSLGPYG